MNNKIVPFNLERALKGEPVVLRDGTKAYIRYYELELNISDPLIGFRLISGKVITTQWTECGHYFWDKKVSVYDIVGMWSEPLVFEHWDMLREDIRFLAKDDNGRWYGYRNKPPKDKEEWGIPRCGSCYPLTVVLNPSLFPDCEWENSLIERPEK